MSVETIKQAGLYYNVIDGTFRRLVPEGTSGSVRREYETKDGTKGVKHEMVIVDIEGIIEDVYITDSEFGRNLNIKLDPNDKGIHPMIKFSIETNYGEDVLKKLPAIDLEKPVKFVPYSFTDQTNGKEKRGVTLYQDGDKIENYFWDDKKKKATNGIPVPKNPETFEKDDWKVHFITVRKFLIEYFTKNVRPKIEAKKPVDAVSAAQEITPEDIPF